MKSEPIDKIRQLKSQQETQEPIFKATSFWEHASIELMDCIEKNNIHNFRSDSACLSYFVPTYGFPGLSLPKHLHDNVLKLARSVESEKHKKIIHQFVGGYFHALADYKAIKSAQDMARLEVFKGFNESSVGNPIEQFEFQGQRVSRPIQNYMLGLIFLLIQDPSATFSTVVEIGGGHGGLGELLFKSNLNTSTYVNFDIPPTCVYADYYLRESLPHNYTQSVDEPWPNSIDVQSLKGAFVRPNWDVTKLQGDIDLFVNFHSFQEMEPAVTKRYIKELTRWNPTYLLLRNIKEGKQLATSLTAGVKEPITSSDYQAWLCDQYTLVASDSLVYGFVTADDFHSEISLWRKK